MRKVIHIVFVLILLACFGIGDAAAQDSIPPATPVRPKREVSPLKATMLAASFPGLGQVYNRKYWKIPLVYAGFGGLGYAVAYNTKYYNQFTKAYQDFTDLVPETDSYLDVIQGADPEDYDPVLFPDSYNPSQAEWISDQLIARIDYFKRYRDLSYIGIAAWYIISILDANVDASLFDYDVGENLNLTLAPFQFPLYNFAGVGVSLTLRINF